MANLKDSGSMREFDTGAHRDGAEGKGRCDLIPLREAADLIGDDVIASIAGFMEDHDERNLLIAMRNAILPGTVYKDVADFLLEASYQYEDGAKKYGENNWKKGLPLDVYIDSAVRHYLKHMRGDTDEPHHRAFAWNMLCALWTVRNENKKNTQQQ